MEKISAVGLDLSKGVIHIQAADKKGRLVWKRKVSPRKLSEVFAQLPEGTEVLMEACATAHHWCRTAAKQGLKARQISPQHVKPFVKSQKNDYRDAEAILEAGSRPTMRYVSTKSVGQQELQAMHCVRSRRIAERTALVNQIRGILAEQGVSITKGVSHLRGYLISGLENDRDLSPSIRALVSGLKEELFELDKRINESNEQISERAKNCSLIKRLMTIPGVGVLSATALAVAIGNPHELKNGRQFAAMLGLVPRQHSTGGKTTLLGITKRGDVYIRTLLIHGARAVIRHALAKDDPHSLWIQKLHAAKGTNLTAVAVANKNARIAWRIMVSTDEYDPALPHASIIVQ